MFFIFMLFNVMIVSNLEAVPFFGQNLNNADNISKVIERVRATEEDNKEKNVRK